MRPGCPRACSTTTSTPRSSSSPRCSPTPTGSRACSTSRLLQHAGNDAPQRLSAFLDRCLPSDDGLAHEWLLWQELDLLCLRKPELAKVGADLYEDLYSSVAAIITDGIETGHFTTDLPPRMVAETAVALCDGLGARVLANDPNLTLADARATLAATVGTLVGHDGPLPAPAGTLTGART